MTRYVTLSLLLGAVVYCVLAGISPAVSIPALVTLLGLYCYETLFPYLFPRSTLTRLDNLGGDVSAVVARLEAQEKTVEQLTSKVKEVVDATNKLALASRMRGGV